MAFCMKTIIPLRVVALTSNIAFLTYGMGLGLAPGWLLHAILLPINGWRRWQGISIARNYCRVGGLIRTTPGRRGRGRSS
jgi:CRP/FNR family transcriptional regulator, cyclic AMP receptor protein